jgi:hypothetical protein
MQQWMLLWETDKNPDPVKAFCDDLMKETRQWVEKGYEINLMIDANEEVGSPPGGLSSVIALAKLFDLLNARHNALQYPNTFARGTKCINFIFGTERVKQYCVSSSILPFGYGYPSDHRAIFIRCDISRLLSTEIHPLESSLTRLLISATPKERKKFIIELDLHYESQNLYNRMQRLWNVNPPDWDNDHTYTKPHPKFTAWACSRHIKDFSSFDMATIIRDLWAAQTTPREIKKKANQLRENHLRELLNITRDANDDRQHERRLQILIQAHNRQNSYRKIQQILKPQVKGGLSYVLVPENFVSENYPYDPQHVDQWNMLYELEELKRLLMLRNITHFGQAHGTPFTVPPLREINWSATDIISE